MTVEIADPAESGCGISLRLFVSNFPTVDGATGVNVVDVKGEEKETKMGSEKAEE